MATAQEQIESLYQSQLGRASDPGGLAYWTNALNSGSSLSDIQNAFQGSQEYQSRAAAPVSGGLTATAAPTAAPVSGGLTATAAPTPTAAPDVVTNAFQQYLGRAPEQAGLDYWTNQMSSGAMTADQVQQAIQNSQEAQSKSAVTNAFNTYLGRAPEQEGLDYWTNAITSGQMTADQAAQAIKNSQEGAVYNAPQTVKDAFQTYLGRAPEQAGLDYWTKQITGGTMSPEQVAAAIRGSNEGAVRGDINNLYQQYLGRDAEAEGLNYWADKLNKGEMSWDQLTNSIAGSDEYGAIIGAKNKEIAGNIPSIFTPSYDYNEWGQQQAVTNPDGSPTYKIDTGAIQNDFLGYANSEYQRLLGRDMTADERAAFDRDQAFYTKTDDQLGALPNALLIEQSILNSPEFQNRKEKTDVWVTDVKTGKPILMSGAVAGLPKVGELLSTGYAQITPQTALDANAYPEAFVEGYDENGSYVKILDTNKLNAAISADPKRYMEWVFGTAAGGLQREQMIAQAGFANSGVSNDSLQTLNTTAQNAAKWLLDNGVSREQLQSTYDTAQLNSRNATAQSIADQQSTGSGFGDMFGDFLEKYQLPIMTAILGGAVLAPAAVGAAGLTAGSAGAAAMTGGVTGLTSAAGSLANGADWKNALITGGLSGLTAGTLHGLGGLGGGAGAIDSGVAGSTVDQASVDAFLSGASGKLTPAELVDYANFFKDQGFNVGSLDVVSSFNPTQQALFERAINAGMDPATVAAKINDAWSTGSSVAPNVSGTGGVPTAQQLGEKVISALTGTTEAQAGDMIPNITVYGEYAPTTTEIGGISIPSTNFGTTMGASLTATNIAEIGGKVDAAQKVVSSSAEQSSESTVKDLYKTLLDRAPEKEALKYWSDLMANGTMTAGQVAGSIIASAEFGGKIGAGTSGTGGGTGTGPGTGGGSGPGGSGPGTGPGGSGPGGDAEGPVTDGEPATEGGTGGGTTVVPPVVVPPTGGGGGTETPTTEPTTDTKTPTTPKIPTIPSLPSITLPKTATSGGAGGVLQHIMPNLTADIVGGTGVFEPSKAAAAQTYSIPQLSNILDLFAPSTAKRGYAEGGLVATEHQPEFYSEGGLNNRYVTGNGDGTSDDVPAMLANGEFVIPADVVSSLGNGSNDSGAAVLDEFLSTIRAHKQKHDPKELPPDSLGALAYLNKATKKAGK